ncbi:MAG TPA: Gfo/Idh/MocA family oxidoreductase [Vicinamibacteria bacterium]
MRLCTIGCGQHAEGSHGPAQARYAANHPGTTLAACCDLDPARAERYRERFGFARSYTDALAMLEAERPEAVVLVVPPEVTSELACRILERGFPLLLEKPPGRTVREVDCMIAAADRGGGGDRPVPHQVAFNRRFVPLLREARRRLAPLAVTHIHYEMTRVDRLDRDFSTTAIHGIDAVRFLAGSDYARARFRYADLPDLGPGVANIFIDAELATGATAHLAFCPAAGALVERVTVHARDHTLFVRVPMWSGPDSPGRLEHFDRGRVADVAGEPDDAFALGGFYGEYEAFLGDLANGRTPSPSLRESRQSVEVAECIRRRESGYHA